MKQTPPEHTIVCPLFAEWKLTDAVREFRETMDISGTAPAIRIPMPNSFIGDVTATITTTTNATAAHTTGPQHIPLIITGWQRTRKGGRFFFGLEVTTTDEFTGKTSPPTNTPQTPAPVPVTPPAGYLSTLKRMHRHGLSLKSSESFIAGILTTVFDRRPQKYHRCRPLLLATDATRIILPDGGIYDLPLSRCLTPEEAASEQILRESYAIYRRTRGYECTAPIPSPTAEPEIYLTADLHLGHRNAIHYYCRPFLPDDPDTMDRVLTENWNHTVRPDDSVIFAGDFTYKAETATTEYYRSHLNGTVTWIKGNHDTDLEDTCPSHTIKADGRTFLVIHNPKHVPATYRGWVIHGHTHNARLGKYPFISFTNKTVNISTDVTGYRPVPLMEILTLIREGEKSGRSEPILIREMPRAQDL
ncbi:metallophosphoesterase [Methanogenium marinum]|uniref:Metallophosphoesterase n=1 Tax=Methanogenium marinum TaxID=348610 RepID=A0A9Q4PUX3_9EURY|nr:metallophosphoesterase family protein [Methanogenium marinum]MDE4907375.1 metallophosphoesterase [Methanogenium marinum]